MRSHPKLNHKKALPLSIIDLRIAAAQQNRIIKDHITTFNNAAVFKIEGEVGLYTFSELMNRVLH